MVSSTATLRWVSTVRGNERTSRVAVLLSRLANLVKSLIAKLVDVQFVLRAAKAPG